jgi:eukaryotic-like serine/threonine-protein kinase
VAGPTGASVWLRDIDAPVTREAQRIEGTQGALWAEDGTIVFQPINAALAWGGHLMRVSARGGTPEALTALSDGEVTQRWPQALPGGHAVLFTSHVSTTQGYENASIVVETIPGRERRTLVQGGYFARYVPGGHLLYIQKGSLFAAPFDLVRLALTGPGVPVLEGVLTNANSGSAQFSASMDGRLVYVAGTTTSADVPLAWIAPSGTLTSVREGLLNWTAVRVSPDGRSLALGMRGADRTTSDL